MCKVIEDMRNEEALRKAREIARRMIERGKLSLEEIAEDTGLEIEVVRQLAGEKTA